MNKRERQLFNMGQQTKGFLDGHSAVWSAIPALTRQKNSLDSRLTDISRTEQTVIDPSKPTTEAKNKMKDIVATKAAVLAGALYAYGAETDNGTLMAQASLQQSDLTRMPDLSVPDRVQQLITLLRANLPELADQAVTEDQILELETTLDDYRVLVGKSRLLVNAKHINGQEVGDLIREMVDDLNDKMDRTMMRFKLTNPSFHEGYTRARTIIDN